MASSRRMLRFLSPLVLTLYGCSISISPSARASTPVLPWTPVPSTTPPSAAVQRIGNPNLPTESLPVTWGDLDLSGRLIFMNSVQSPNSLSMSIKALDLITGEVTTIFQAPDTAWIDFMSVAPDVSKLVMAYLPPRDARPPGANGQQALFTLPLDGSAEPELVFAPPSSGYQYFQPSWSPDGVYIYFAAVDYDAPLRVPGQHYSYYETYRLRYPGGTPEKLAEQAFWPRLSRDGARLAYVTVDLLDGSNKLFVANADGSAPYPVELSGLYVPPIIDAPIFTADDQSVLYSAVTRQQSSTPNWIERLLGVTVAFAHTVPSDWWSVPIGGGTPKQLTYIAQAGLYGSLSPDGQWLASYSGNGIFVMRPDGTQLTVLVADMGGIAGTVSWIP